METRKRSARVPFGSSSDDADGKPNAVPAKFPLRRKKHGRQSPWFLPVLLATMAVFILVYEVVSYQILVSSNSVLPTSSRILSQKIPYPLPAVKPGIVDVSFIPKRPRMVGIYFESADSRSFVGEARLDPNVIQVAYQPKVHRTDMTAKDMERQNDLENSNVHRGAKKWEDGDCVAQHEWQKRSFPTCNLLLEKDMTNFGLDAVGEEPTKLLAHGAWRDVWKNKEHHSWSVVKTIRYEHEYTWRNYDRHRRDSIAMERMTASPYVLDIYGFCGNSGIFEFADGGDIYDNLFHLEDTEHEWSSTEKLLVSQQVAAGLSALHNETPGSVPAIAHTDITPRQYVFVVGQGIFKLNDFNRARFFRWNKNENKICPFRIGANRGTFRSPEEYAYELETEKVDIYSMGNIFYVILTRLWPFEDESRSKKAGKRVRAGERPPIEEKYLNSTDPYIQAMVGAIRMCWVQDPTKRASAAQVKAYIEGRLQALGAPKSR